MGVKPGLSSIKHDCRLRVLRSEVLMAVCGPDVARRNAGGEKGDQIGVVCSMGMVLYIIKFGR